MVWQFDWLRSWDEVWDPVNLARWRAAFAPDSGAEATPFMHPDVVRAWLQSAGEAEYDPFFYWAEHSGGQSVFALMVRRKNDWRSGFTRMLQPVGGAQFDYHEPVALPSGGGALPPDAGFWPDFVREMHRREGSWFDVLALPHIRADRFGGGALGAVKDAAPFLRLAPYADGEQYLMSRSKKLRGVVRRTERRLAEDGTVTFAVHGPSDLATVLAWIPALVGEKRKKYPSCYPIEHAIRYLSNLATEGLANGVVHCSSLALDGESISWEVNFLLNGVFYGYSCAFDSRFDQISLGSLHNYRMIEWLIQNDGQIYDFLVGQEEYKYNWTDGEAFRIHGLEIKSTGPTSLMRRGVRRGLNRLGQTALPALRQGTGTG
jgi:CelD/BcsL family acetyltransferase involved in cellulose biosynthesis